MAESSIVGARIRERRVRLGLRQSELAREAGISPSYLNLIEHNRRRIGGKILNRLAELLKVDPAQLADGAEAALSAGLREAAGERLAALRRPEEFAARLPGWAQLTVDLGRRVEALEANVKTLTDRLSHDPLLAESLHDVISTVTAIRSTSSILVDTKELEPEWRARFHRNIHEDSRRLAEGAESLVRYLEAAPDTGAEIRAPEDEVQAFLAEHDYHFPELEDGGDEAEVSRRIIASEMLQSDAARRNARSVLTRYRTDAAALPLEALRAALARHGLEPGALSRDLGCALPLLFRRLASLPEAEQGPVGLVGCDLSGSWIYRKPVPGFALPRGTGGCALWPLYQVLALPQLPLRRRLRQPGPEGSPVEAVAAAEWPVTPGLGDPVQLQAWMLLVPVAGSDASGTLPQPVGSTCRLCAVPDCAARREVSVLTEGF